VTPDESEALDLSELIYVKWDDGSDGWYVESELEVIDSPDVT
jgi:hypothetical protein